jgi:hypothetical protein
MARGNDAHRPGLAEDGPRAGQGRRGGDVAGLGESRQSTSGSFLVLGKSAEGGR